MANVQKYFDEFHKRIRTDYRSNSTLKEKRNIILKRIANHLAENDRPGFRRLLQGSYKMKTGVIPIEELEYDIDVGLRFGITEHEYDAGTVRSWVYEAVDGHTESVEEHGPCIRVTYKDKPVYHVDLVTYANWIDEDEKEQFRLGHKTDGWLPSEPKDLIQYVTDKREPFKNTKDTATQTDQFRRVVRYQRRWIDERIPEMTDAKPPGIAFTLLAAERLAPHVDWVGDPDDLSALASIALSASTQSGRIVVKKPTQEYDDVFCRLSNEEMDDLKSGYKEMYEALMAAKAETAPEKACAILQKIFGRDFPVPKSEEVAKATAAPAIVTSSRSG
ncbi:MAG: nucleotidyltransferase [Pyrinomonadaceae bacterium]